MKRLVPLLIGAIALPALAQAPEPPVPPANPTPPVLPTPEVPEPVGGPEPATDGPVSARGTDRESDTLHRDCVQETGTRIRSDSRAARGAAGDDARAERDCVGPGRSYSREDIERTGETDVGRALERLDPSVRGNR